MNEIDLLTLFIQEQELLGTFMMSFISILFAFVIAIFLVGPKLPNWILYLMTLIYSIFGLPVAAAVLQTQGRIGRIREELAMLPNDTTSPIIQGFSGIPGWTEFYTIFLTLLLVGSYFISISFLVYVVRKKTIE